MKHVAIPITAVLLISIVSIPDSYGDQSRKKLRFWGEHKMIFYGEPEIDFRIDPLTPRPYVVDAKVRIGDSKVELFGGGFIKPDYYYYDKQCKSLKGFEYLWSNNGDFVRIDYYGKVCYMGSNVKTVNLIFTGKDPKGIFENAEIGGTFSGSSDRYEMLYNLSISSILTFNK